MTARRVDRVLSFFSSRRNWDPPTPSPAGESVPPPLWLGRGGGGGGGEGHTRLQDPNSDEGKDTVVH